MISRRPTAWTVATAFVLTTALLAPGRASAASSLAAWLQSSPDDITGFATLTGDDAVANATIPFTVTIEGAPYTTVAISTNGWLEFGGNTCVSGCGTANSDPVNTTLPTSKHTKPFLAAFWDDLQTFSNAIRYGTVGTAPNRVFIVDYDGYDVDPTTEQGSADDGHFQVEVHEGSNLINVRYHDTGSNLASGLSATIGWQGAGGASANAQPLSANARTLDDNRPNEGWSVDVGRAGLITLAATIEESPDDISGFTTLSGNDVTSPTVTLPFNVTVEGTSYSSLVISTNGWVELGSNTSGSSDPTNNCLPVSNHTNPLIAVYWDDMQTQGNNIRYGTTGTAPNRIFVVDWQIDVVAQGGGDVINAQLQIHETSNLIHVRYRDGGNSNANGQAATIGFQGAGGATAAAYPITCNGKVMDDNQADESWSVHPKAGGAMSLHAIMAFSPDDITGFTPLTGDNNTATATIPFSVKIDGVNYSTVAISTNGWLEFGGNTQGTSDPTNAALPTSKHTNPFLAAFWDDLQPEGNNVRYGTVGTAPNRTFIVDEESFILPSPGSSVDGIYFQVEIHETSNVISVKYRVDEGGADGQTATIGFQGAGGASATAYPLVFNGKILDDNRQTAGWSLSPLPVCGNGIVETKETCDESGSNGAAASCCTSTCQLRASGQTCRTSAGQCDVAETCTGSSATCPADGFASSATSCTGSSQGGTCDGADHCSGTANACVDVFLSSSTQCRASAGQCDVAESCTGSSGACPADSFASSSTSCAGSSQGGACDGADHCSGGSNTCVDVFLSSSTVCRGSAGQCDIAETCTGSSGACPADAFASSSTSCTGSSQGAACDDDTGDHCTGTSNTCVDGFQSSSTVCRASAGQCDVAESCTGTSGACPADGFAASSTSCTGSSQAGACDDDAADRCSGTSNTCADGFKPSTTVCRAAAGACDLAETCTGSSGACPADAKSTAECRASAGTCDVAETCDGVSDDCPADALAPATTECRASAGVCDLAEHCTGSSVDCPADAKSAAECRPSAGVCDLAETCDGVSNDCPADAFEPATTECRASAGVCDLAENCTGSNPDCPADAKSTDECRPSAGICDIAESCDGVNDDCPADALEPTTTECRGSAGQCDLAENCTGSSADCPADAKSTDECRPSAGICDVAESCDGVNDDCPADAKSTAECRAAAGVCDVAEVCDGVNDDCPADGFEPASTTCRATAGVCDLAEHCTGSSAACPADAKSTAECRASAGACDVAETCDGVSDDCPADALAPATHECRAAQGACDLAENCTGSSAACPPDAKSANTVECRASAGDCDVAEFCDGIGNDCPADTFQAATVECRAAQGVCDLAEQCTGTTATCPPDAKQASTVQCRPAAGDCDVAEFCDGIDDDCPANTVASITHQCRAASGVCDVAENCDGSSTTCPADAFAPATTVCRPAADDCDAAEHCTGASPTCPIDASQPDGTACNDGQTCTIDDTCVGGTCSGDSMICGDGIVEASCGEECDDGNTISGDGCSSTCQTEFVCGPAPQLGCRQPIAPGKAKIALKDKTPDTKDVLGWKWTKGATTPKADFGSPTTTTDYLLCIYDDGRGLVLSASAPADQQCAGKPCWSVSGTGFKYKDKDATPDGLTQIVLKEGLVPGKAKIIVKGKGTNLQMPTLPMTQPVTVQLRNSNGVCWQANYSAPPQKNDSQQYKDKAD